MSKMYNTVAEIDAAMMHLPTDSEQRAALMWRRYELLEAARVAAAYAKEKAAQDRASGIIVNALPDTTDIITMDGERHTAEVDITGRRFVRIRNFNDFRALLHSEQGMRWQQIHREPRGAVELLAA